MGYTPYLISNFSTGLDRERQPWLLPQDAFPILLDGYIYRGVLSKREGYHGFANGIKSTYTESRMVHQISGAAGTGAINGANQTYTWTLTTPVRRGTVVISGSNPVQEMVDDGVGGFTGDGTGTVDYTTGAVSITFDAAPIAGTVTATYDYHQGLPVLGLMSFYTADNTRQLILADTTYVNRYNPVTDRLDDITVTPFAPAGTNVNFWSWVNYPDPNDINRLLFVNNKVPIQRYIAGTSPEIEEYPVYTSSSIVTGEAFSIGTGANGPYVNTLGNIPILKRYLTVTAGAQSVTDDGFGNLTGAGTGTVDYTTGSVSVTFTSAVGVGDPITASYTALTVPLTTALQIFENKDRLVILRPTYAGQVFPRRILISGTGIYTDTFVSQAPGAGFIDIPDNTWIQGASFNRDDLLIFTQTSTWALKYTGNEVVPFSLYRLDESRGSDAPFSPITYLNRTMAISRRGMIISDGYRVERMDNKLPDFISDDIDNANLALCFSGFVDEDRDVYMLYPESGQAASRNTRILVVNFEEDTFAVYRLPLSVMGSFQQSFTWTWNDLTAENGFPDWDSMGSKFGTWEEFGWGDGTVVALGGGENGQLWKINIAQEEDDPQTIRSISVTPGAVMDTVTVVTDFNTYQIGDMIAFDGISGLSGINSTQVRLISVVTPNTEFTVEYPGGQVTGSYDANTGLAKRVIPFEAKTKRFNPFIDKDKKLQLGYVYFYVDTSVTALVNPTTGQPVNTMFRADVILNDTNTVSVPRKYEVNCTNLPGNIDEKRWYKMWANSTGQFVQLLLSHEQSGGVVNIQAMMLGLKPVGRLI